ncbi:MAG: APC family permease [Bacillota bacterium]
MDQRAIGYSEDSPHTQDANPSNYNQTSTEVDSLWSALKRHLIGEPLPTWRLMHERLTKFKALAVFSSDAMSSVAYAVEEILLVLVLAGAAALYISLPITLAIIGLLIILTISYRQTIHAYPSGGGAYIVAKENLGVTPGLTAGSALMIDYILTVAVSVTAGVAAITSAFPVLLPDKVSIGILIILLITIANLRGVRDSATIFAMPTYFFIISMALLIFVGFFKLLTGGPVDTAPPVAITAIQPITIFLVLRAFASGCAALTGVEAISNGVPAFKPPEAKNASNTLAWMAGIIVFNLVGVAILAYLFGIVPHPGETVVSQIAARVFGRNIFYYFLQASTALILVLAANTSYADFPRLASLIAKDGFLPRILFVRGERLVFSYGIIALGALAALLIIIFRGDTHALIPLYAVGVFLSFTLSQSGMVMHWIKAAEKNWRNHALVNGSGALVTGIVSAVIIWTKFTRGAWIIVVLIPIVVRLLFAVKSHYQVVASELTTQGYIPENFDQTAHIIVPIGTLNKVALKTLRYAQTLSTDVTAVNVAMDPSDAEKLKEKFEDFKLNQVKLVILDSPYRALIGPLIKYIEEVESLQQPGQIVTVLLPEFVPRRWWHYFLHNQTGFLVKTALFLRRDTVVASVPYHLHH